jgi:hypothetical protein
MNELRENFHHSDLELLMTCSDWRELKRILTVEERRAIQYYNEHRRGENKYYHPRWATKVDEAIAHINAHVWKQLNQRLAIYDQIEGRYWAGLGIWNEPWCKTKTRCLLFLEKDRKRLEKICDRSNKNIGHRRFLVVTIDATSRLKLNKPF